MAPRDFEESICLRQVSKDKFENIHEPWTWPFAPTIPGGLLIAMAAAAASQTVSKPDKSSKFGLSSIQTSFLSAPTASRPILYQVTRATEGRRFTIRTITATQNQPSNAKSQTNKPKLILTATATFTNRAAMPSTKDKNVLRQSHARTTTATISEITLDDLDIEPAPVKRWMSFQRLPVHSPHSPPSTVTDIMLAACRIKGRIDRPPGDITHLLGLLMLSDYHVLDGPLTINGIPFGLWKIGDKTRTNVPRGLTFGTSLNHAVYIHDWGDGESSIDGTGGSSGWRADEICYVEVTCPWAGGGRCVVNTRLYAGKEERLVASCVQESYYMLADDVDVQAQSKIALEQRQRSNKL